VLGSLLFKLPTYIGFFLSRRNIIPVNGKQTWLGIMRNSDVNGGGGVG
jgi:hypothetical protein